MFIEIAPLIVAGGTTLKIVVTAATDGEITLMIAPENVSGQCAALTTPLLLTGTPAELDAELPEILTNYVRQRTTLVEQAENMKIIMEAAGKAASDNASKAVNKGAGKPNLDAAEDGEEDESSVEANHTVRTSHARPSIAAKPKDDSSDLDLF